VATANDGSLHIVQTKNTDVKTLAVFEPEAKAGAATECISGATIVYADEQEGLFVERKEEKDNKDNKEKDKDKEDEKEEEEETPEPEMEDFIVYAVVDKKGENLADTSSRLIAVDMEGNLKWSYSYSGRIEGSPVVGKSGIYVTTNYNGFGIVSVLKLSPEDGNVELSASAGAYAELGPPALRQPAMNQNENNNQDINEDAGDFVIVAESWDSGFSETQGGLYMIPEALLTTSRDDKEREDVETDQRFEYKLTKISSWAFSAIAPPMVVGDSIYVGAAGANVGGFTGNRRNDLSGIEEGEDEIFPRWEIQLPQNQLNASQPFLTQPVLGNGGNYVCLAGVDNDFSCLLSQNGRQIWRVEEQSQIVAKPIIFAGERRNIVYVIEKDQGRVHQYDLFNGRRYWDYGCADAWEDLCQDPVEADFALAPSGNTIYYGDVYGRITSLGVAIFETSSPTTTPTGTPTSTPTASPTATRYPTQMPVVNITVLPPPEESGKIDIENSDIDNALQLDESVSSAMADQGGQGEFNRTTVYITAAAAGLCAALIPIALFAILKKRKRQGKGKKPEKEMAIEIVEEFSSDNGSSDDLEAQAQAFFESIEANNVYDDGDGIEVEMISHASPVTKKKKKKLPKTPETVNASSDSIKEIVDDSSAMVVLGRQYDADQSVEAVNLRKTFDQQSEKNTDYGESDDEVPPPPPMPNETPVSPSGWSWASRGSKTGKSPRKSPGKSPASQRVKKASQIKLQKAPETPDLRQPMLSRPTSPVPQSSASVSGSVSASVSASVSPSVSASVSTSVATSVATNSQKEKSSSDQSSVKKGAALSKKKRMWGRKNKNIPPAPSPKPEPKKELKKEPEPKPEPEDPPSLTLKPEKKVEPETPVLTKSEDQAPVEEEVKEEAAPEPAIPEEKNEVKKSDTITESVTEPPPTPISPAPSAYSMAKESLEGKSPSRSAQSTPMQSVRSIHENLFGSPSEQSASRSITSDDSSLYTSYTLTAGIAAMFVGAAEEKEKKEISPFSSYLYDQDIRRRDRDEIVNENKSFLTQPSLSADDECPDDELPLRPRTHRGSAPKTEPYVHGSSARSNRDSSNFLSKKSENEEGATTISQMYDQLAAIGQQRREEKKPAFRRRNKRTEQANPPRPTPPAAQQQKQGEGDTWGSFLSELAEAEKSFFQPSESKSKSLLNESSTEDIGECQEFRCS